MAYGEGPAQQRRWCQHYGGDATRRAGATAAQQGGGGDGDGGGRALQLIQESAARYDQHMSAKHGVPPSVGRRAGRTAANPEGSVFENGPFTVSGRLYSVPGQNAVI